MPSRLIWGNRQIPELARPVFLFWGVAQECFTSSIGPSVQSRDYLIDIILFVKLLFYFSEVILCLLLEASRHLFVFFLFMFPMSLNLWDYNENVSTSVLGKKGTCITAFYASSFYSLSWFYDPFF